jgi:NADPH:quinone reductase-like Zn-dependent oxidoreductase
MDTYSIPEDHIFYSRNLSFAEGIMRTTKNLGVDVILNSLAGQGLRASWECIARVSSPEPSKCNHADELRS